MEPLVRVGCVLGRSPRCRVQFAAVLLLLLSGAAAKAQRASPADSLSALSRAESALRSFDRQWRTFVDSRRARPRSPVYAQCELPIGTHFCYGPRNGRVAYGAFGSAPNADLYAPDIVPRIVRRTADSLLSRLFATLGNVRDVIPNDRWVNGQMVRISLESGRPYRALEEAISCTPRPSWWCDALLAHTLHLIGGVEHYADSVWTTALGRMPPEQRCAWLDPSPVIASDSIRRALAAMSCADRVVESERIWWLSDPLYLTGGNERRSEHLSRRASLLLDNLARERLDSMLAKMKQEAARVVDGDDSVLADLTGVDPVRAPPLLSLRESPDGYEELVQRLGVPGYLHPTSPDDLGQIKLVGLYPDLRYSFVPSADVLADPLHSDVGQWALDRDEPFEFYAPPLRKFVQLDYQCAVFKRGDSARAVLATDISRWPMLRYGGTRAGVVMRRSPADPAMRHERRISDWFAVGVDLPPGGALLSMEVLSGEEGWAGRVRLGASAPPMPYQRITISDVLLTESRDEPPVNLKDAEPYALGTTRVTAGGTYGLYWEVYGLVEGDTARFSITVVREPPTLLERLGRAITLRFATDSSTIGWEEHVARSAAIEPRAINLDLGSLSPGSYSLVLSLAVPGQRVVNSTRFVEIVNRRR